MYHGADHSSHILAKVGGFLLLPAFGSLATKLAATTGESVLPNAKPGYVAAAAGTLAFGALAYGLYKASESDSHSEAVQCFLRGGMWGSGIAAAFCAGAPALSDPGPTVVTSGKYPKLDKAFNLLTSQAALAVATKRTEKAKASKAALPVTTVAPK